MGAVDCGRDSCKTERTRNERWGWKAFVGSTLLLGAEAIDSRWARQATCATGKAIERPSESVRRILRVISRSSGERIATRGPLKVDLGGMRRQGSVLWSRYEYGAVVKRFTARTSSRKRPSAVSGCAERQPDSILSTAPAFTQLSQDTQPVTRDSQ